MIPLARGAPGPLTMVRNIAADLRLLDLLVRVRHLWADGRRAREAKRITPKILATMPTNVGGQPPKSWAEYRFLRTVSDMAVTTVGPPEDSPRALIKFATTTAAAHALRRERSALATLHADARLAQLSGILPTVLAEGDIAGRPYVVQAMLPGVSASRLVATDDGATKVLTAAVSSLGELHTSTAASATVSSAMLERWVGAPANALRRFVVTPKGRACVNGLVDRLTGQLHGALEGRTLPVGWVHGDFVPANILMPLEGAAVAGIVDWESADSDGLPLVDVVALLISTRAHRQRRELGFVVREFVTGGNWSALEESLFDSASSRLEGDPVDSRTLVLLWWLQQVAGNLTKSIRYSGTGLWARLNILPVLEALRRA